MAILPQREVFHYERMFCKDVLEAGTGVFLSSESYNNILVCTKKTDSVKGKPIGVALNNVVNFDKNQILMLDVAAGGIINVLTNGYITVKMKKGLNPPMFQSIYVNPKNGKLTWKEVSLKVGLVAGKQDKNGFVRLQIRV